MTLSTLPELPRPTLSTLSTLTTLKGNCRAEGTPRPAGAIAAWGESARASKSRSNKGQFSANRAGKKSAADLRQACLGGNRRALLQGGFAARLAPSAEATALRPLWGHAEAHPAARPAISRHATGRLSRRTDGSTVTKPPRHQNHPRPFPSHQPTAAKAIRNKSSMKPIHWLTAASLAALTIFKCAALRTCGSYFRTLRS